MNLWIHAYTHTPHKYLHTLIFVHSCMYTCFHIHEYTHTHLLPYIWAHSYLYIDAYTHSPETHINADACMSMHTHTHTNEQDKHL